MALRRQISLYVPDHLAAPLDAVRRVLDPVQHALIPAHVTLCRDDEAALLSGALITEALAGAPPITLVFGRAIMFDGHGVLLPCVVGADQFMRLRERLLGAGLLGTQKPHITLAHPRNPRAPGNTLDAAHKLPSEIALTFPGVNLIAQTPGEPWRVLHSFVFG